MHQYRKRIISRIISTAALLAITTCCSPASGAHPDDRVPGGVLVGPLVISDRWPECTDLTTWTRDVMRLERVEEARETEQAKVFFRWLRLFSKMAVGGMLQAYEGEYGSENYVVDAHKNLFVYGWGYCDTHSRIAEAAWTEYKQTPSRAQRVITQHDNGGYHTMYRLKLDGHWGAFDARYGYYLIENDAPNARILDWAEVGVDANIIHNAKYRHRSRPFFEFFGQERDRAFLIEPRFFESEASWHAGGAPKECVFADSQYEQGTVFHDMSFHLPKGTTITRYWDNRLSAIYVPACKLQEPFLPSGRFYRVTENMFDGNWPHNDPNYQRCAPYLVTVPQDQGYPAAMRGDRTIGQASGEISYAPQWDKLASIDAAGIQTDMIFSKEVPYVRPRETAGAGNALLDFYCPYVLVDGTLRGEWIAVENDRPAIQMRTLRPKPANRAAPDRWSEWQTIHAGPGKFNVELGRDRFNGADVTIHGKYHFQLRLSLQDNPQRRDTAGLRELNLHLTFENGIMSIPRIQTGGNLIRFKVQDASAIQGPIDVVYRYETHQGLQSHSQTLYRVDFVDNEAQYRFDVDDLVRCDSLLIKY